jgi:hypothetical protein
MQRYSTSYLIKCDKLVSKTMLYEINTERISVKIRITVMPEIGGL